MGGELKRCGWGFNTVMRSLGRLVCARLDWGGREELMVIASFAGFYAKLLVASALVLLGGVFAGLTLALMSECWGNRAAGRANACCRRRYDQP